eukprot:RCo036071
MHGGGGGDFEFVWWKLVLSLGLLVCSGFFAGLTLGLMGLDTTSLRVVATSGPPQERKYAQRILPLREKGNQLLCTLLIGNVIVNAFLSILMADMTGGLIGLVISTLFIVIFGEIIPQATCSRHALKIGSFLIPAVKFCILLLWPVTKPLALILDCILGGDVGQIYDKNELRQLLHVHAERVKESGIKETDTALMGAALDFTSAQAVDIMTKLEDVFSLSIDTILDEEVMTSIWQNGHSRIPVYDKDPSDIVDLLFVKDLSLIHPDDRMRVRTLVGFYPRTLHKVFVDTSLPELLKLFKSGRGHLALVQRVNSSGDGDPFYENAGLVTLEDVIERLIQDEIEDETDVDARRGRAV